MRSNSRSKKNRTSGSRSFRRRKNRKHMATHARSHLKSLYQFVERPPFEKHSLVVLRTIRHLYRSCGIGFGKDLHIRGWKILLCPKCGNVLYPGRTCRVRTQSTRSAHLAVTCLKCKQVSRLPINKKPKTQKKINTNTL